VLGLVLVALEMVGMVLVLGLVKELELAALELAQVQECLGNHPLQSMFWSNQWNRELRCHHLGNLHKYLNHPTCSSNNFWSLKALGLGLEMVPEMVLESVPVSVMGMVQQLDNLLSQNTPQNNRSCTNRLHHLMDIHHNLMHHQTGSNNTSHQLKLTTPTPAQGRHETWLRC